MPQGWIVLSLLLFCAPLCAQEAPDLDELWRTGCLWQVGDNVARVAEAREAIVETGESGLQYAMGKLGASSTLEIRCLTAVIRGFDDRAVQPLIKNVAHENEHARRNVADLLAALNATESAPDLLKQAAKETSLGARLAQLSALAKWEVAEAAPIAVNVSKDHSQRARQRAAGLLASFDTSASNARLVELLEDDAYYVRNAAIEALKNGPLAARAICIERLRALLKEPDPAPGPTRRLLPIVAKLADAETPGLLTTALAHKDGGVRAEAAHALAAWKTGAGALEDLDVNALLKGALSREVDPFAKVEIEAAQETLTKPE